MRAPRKECIAFTLVALREQAWDIVGAKDSKREMSALNGIIGFARFVNTLP
jgi:hypothetical protein